jgi:hypothetical protein
MGGKTKVIMWYFGEWSFTAYSPADRAGGHQWVDGVKAIQPYFPEREPLLNAHDLTKFRNPQVVRQHVEWMMEYGVDIIGFAWYWQPKIGETHIPVNEPERRVQEARYLWSYIEDIDVPNKIPYFLLFSPAGLPVPESLEDWNNIIDHWVDEHFWRPEYHRVDGKPLLFYFTHNMVRVGRNYDVLMTVNEFLDYGRNRAIIRSTGHAKYAQPLTGIYIGVCMDAGNAGIGNGGAETLPEFYEVLRSNIDCIGGYNYHWGVAPMYPNPPANPKSVVVSFQRLDISYREQWEWFLANTDKPYFVPMSAGWDHRPWGDSDPTGWDRRRATPEEFEEHIIAGRDFILANQGRTKGYGSMCSWNEWGEGNYLEPTKRVRFTYIEKILKIFSDTGLGKFYRRNSQEVENFRYIEKGEERVAKRFLLRHTSPKCEIQFKDDRPATIFCLDSSAQRGLVDLSPAQQEIILNGTFDPEDFSRNKFVNLSACPDRLRWLQMNDPLGLFNATGDFTIEMHIKVRVNYVTTGTAYAFGNSGSETHATNDWIEFPITTVNEAGVDRARSAITMRHGTSYTIIRQPVTLESLDPPVFLVDEDVDEDVDEATEIAFVRQNQLTSIYINGKRVGLQYERGFTNIVLNLSKTAPCALGYKTYANHNRSESFDLYRFRFTLGAVYTRETYTVPKNYLTFFEREY